MHDEVHAEIDRSSKKKSGGGRLRNRLNILEKGQGLKSEKVLRLGQVLAALRGLQPAAAQPVKGQQGSGSAAAAAAAAASGAVGEPLAVEVAGLVAATDGSKALLVMPEEFWMLLEDLHHYAEETPQPGAWGAASAAAAARWLVHVCFTFDRTAVGRMQAVLPVVATSSRLLLPPQLLSSSVNCTAAEGAAAVSTASCTAAARVAAAEETSWQQQAVQSTSRLAAVARLSTDKQHEVLQLQLISSVAWNTSK
jgi:hypothetical protein